jgi:Protein of unknown function (DUF2809)
MSRSPGASASGPVRVSRAGAFLRTRWGRIVSLALVIAVGLVSRRHPIGVRLYDKNLGDALYAATAYLALALLRPRWTPVQVGGAAVGVCVAVELFQLTGIPARYASIAPVRWLLGTEFAWEDIACYLAGVVAVAGLDRRWRRGRDSAAAEENLFSSGIRPSFRQGDKR